MENKKLLTLLLMGLFLLFGTKISIAQTDFWEQTNGPEGGFIHAFAILPSEDILAATNGGGIFLSIDNGNSWTEVNDGLDSIQHTHIESFVIDDFNGYIFGGAWGTFGGVYRSPINNISWTKFNDGMTNIDVECLAINSSGDIFAGTDGGGVFLSVDQGQTWTPVNNGLTKQYVWSLAIDSNGNIYAGGGSGISSINCGIFRSTDNGANWDEVYTGATSNLIWTLFVDTSNGTERIFAGIWREGISYSYNGIDWFQFNNTGLNPEIRSFAIDSSGDIFVGTTFGLFRFAHGATNWTYLDIGLNDLYIEALAIKPFGSNEYIFAGSSYGRGILRSEDNGENWIPKNGGLIDTRIQCLDINSSGDIFAGTMGSGIFRTADNGKNWTQVNSGLIFPDVRALGIKASSGDIFAAVPNNGVFKSTDNGENWTQTSLDNGSVWCIAFNSSGHIFAGTYWGDGIFRSTDNGGTWVPVNTGLPSIPNIPNIQALSINSSDYIFASTYDKGVFRTMDNGNYWTEVNNGLTNFYVKALAIHPVSGDILAGTWGSGLFRSDDNGDTWTHVQNSPWYIQSLAINSEGHIFTGYGFYRSTDGGQTWQELSAGLKNLDIQDFVIDHSGYLYAATRGCGVFRSVETTYSNEPPISVCKDIEIPADENCQASITADDVDGGSYDPDDDPITLSIDNTGPFSLGEHYVNLTVTDENGASDTCQALVTVVDATPPEIFFSYYDCVNVGKGKGKMANKLTISASDNCTGEVNLIIDKVEVFNNGGQFVKGKGVYDIIGNDIYIYPNANGWSIKVTATGIDDSGNPNTQILEKALIKCKK